MRSKIQFSVGIEYHLRVCDARQIMNEIFTSRPNRCSSVVMFPVTTRSPCVLAVMRLSATSAYLAGQTETDRIRSICYRSGSQFRYIRMNIFVAVR